MATSKPVAQLRRPPTAATPARTVVPEDVAERFLAGGGSGAPGASDGSSHPEPSAAIPTKPRAAAGTATLRQLKDGRTVRRMQVYLSPGIASTLETFCARERRELSGVVEAALREYLTKEGR